MNLSPLGHQLVHGNPQAWADLLGRAVQRVKTVRPGYTGSSSRLRRLDVFFRDGDRLGLLVKFTDRYEARVYRDLAPRLPLDVPRAYHVEQDGNDGLCILEALPPGKPITAWSDKDERQVLGDLARLHATFWHSPELDDYAWLIRLEDDVNARLDKAERGLALLRQVGGWPGLITPDMLRLMDALLADRAHLLHPLVNLAPTLIHCDAWQPNWVLGDNRRVLLDWQSVARGPAVWDVVYFLQVSGEAGGRLPMEENEAIECYLDALEKERGQADARHRAEFRAVVPVVSVVNTLARWAAYALDYLRPIETWPVLARVWTGLPTGVRRSIEARVAWTDLEYYRQTFARFEEHARAINDQWSTSRSADR